MTDVVQDQKDEVKAPSLAYIDKPKIPSKANQAEIRLSEHPANQAADDDSEGF